MPDLMGAPNLDDLPSSTDALFGGGNPLLDGLIPYDLYKDEDGSEIFHVRLPGRVTRMIDDMLGRRDVPMRNRSDFLRAAIYHYLKHASEMIDDPDTVMEWTSIEAAARAAQLESQRANDITVVENLSKSIRAALEDYDLDTISYSLEHFFEPLLKVTESNPRRRAFFRLGKANPTVWRAVQDARKRSTIVQDVFEIMSEMDER